jgi:HTH-like domain
MSRSRKYPEELLERATRLVFESGRPMRMSRVIWVSRLRRSKTGVCSARQLEDERLLERIREVHEANYCAYGYRRTWKALTRVASGCRAARCSGRCAPTGSKAPSAAASRGEPPHPTARLAGAPTWSTATSRRPHRTSCGSRTSRI